MIARLRVVFASSLFLTAISLLSYGCADVESGCRDDGDCRTGRVCLASACVDPDANNGFNNGVNNGSNNGSNNGANNGSNNGANNGSNNGANNGFLDMGTPDMPPPSDMGTPDMPPPTDMGTPDMPPPSDMGTPDMPPPSDMGTPDMPPADMGPDMPPTDMGPDMPPVVGPQIRVTPTDLDFGTVVLNTTITTPILIENIGDQDLILSSVNFRTASTGFALTPVVSAPLTVAPGSSTSVDVSFTPLVVNRYRNDVVVASNDADDASVQVSLVGRGRNATTQSCFFASPADVDFGVVLPGSSASQTFTVGNCGSTANVTVTAADVLRNPMGPFAFTLPQATPFVLAPGATQTVTVDFTPTSAADVRDVIRFRSDAVIGTQADVDLFGSGGGCVTPVPLAENRADPVDVLRSAPVLLMLGDVAILDGSATQSPSGSVVHSWTVTDRPAGSTAMIVNGNATTFSPDVVGSYTISLESTDPSAGISGCGPETIEIVATAARPALRAVASWNADHDLDLHLVRNEMMSFNFFDPLNDAHYDNLSPDWGVSAVRTDDAFHHGDDTDGFGPEIVDLVELEAGRTYRVGVQFGSRSGFQPSQFSATLRLVYRPAVGPAQPQTLTHTFYVTQLGTMWITFEVDGTTGQITTLDSTQ